MTDLSDVEEAERLHKLATKGPWTVELYGEPTTGDLVIHSDPDNRVCFMATPGRDYERPHIAANASSIAALHNTADLLFARSRRCAELEEVVAKQVAILDKQLTSYGHFPDPSYAGKVGRHAELSTWVLSCLQQLRTALGKG